MMVVHGVHYILKDCLGLILPHFRLLGCLLDIPPNHLFRIFKGLFHNIYQVEFDTGKGAFLIVSHIRPNGSCSNYSYFLWYRSGGFEK